MPGASLRGPRLAVVLLAGVLTGGTVGYMVIEGWSAWDAFYMTVTTVATVGFREVHPLSLGGQVFTILLIFCGVGTAFYTVTLLATIIVEGGLHRRFEKRRWQGQVFCLLILNYAVIRFGTEFLRADNPPIYFGLTLSQVISLALGTVAAMILVRGKSQIVSTMNAKPMRAGKRCSPTLVFTAPED